MRDCFLEVPSIRRRIRSWSSVSILLLLIATAGVYLRPSILSGRDALVGFDYSQLHQLRIAFARAALLGPLHRLPAWCPRQLLGAPFAANLQSFPWIPTRLVLLLLDPTVAYAWGVALAAALAALFTYLYLRRVGLSVIGAMAAGWTFACAGFFTSRVEAGQLGLLEAYPALPLLLWLSDRAISADRAKHLARDLTALAIASACVVVAGHPQLPAYSLAAAMVYVAVRARGWVRIKALLAFALGAGTTLCAWWPMLLLARHSTRVLHLGTPSNDIAMPYGRLLALLIPGINGWADGVIGSEQKPFVAYPNLAYFWDTASYVGWLPLLAIVILLVRSLMTKRLPRWPWVFLAAMGVGALILALPVAGSIGHVIPLMLLRSPARLLYLSTLSAAAALGFVVDLFLNSKLMTLRARQVVVAGCLLFHAADLVGFAQHFIETTPRTPEGAQFAQVLAREVKNARIATDGADAAYAGRYDDAGIFDSILLTNPYRAIVGLAGVRKDLNEERLDSAEFAIPALQAAGVRFVITAYERTDLKLVSESDEAYLYEVPNPLPRAAFFTASMTEFLPASKLVDEFLAHRQPGRLLLPSEARTEVADPPGTNECPPSIEYRRPSSDEIQLDTVSMEPGFAEVLEAYDAGWSAEVDEAPTRVWIANGYIMAVRVGAGRHTVRLRYHTPGRAMGGVLSMVSVCLLAGLVWTTRNRGGRI